MATLQATTVSNGAQVTDLKAVKDLCKAYDLQGLNWELTDDGELVIWGYDTFAVWPRSENGDPTYDESATHEFLFALAEYVADGEEFDIRTVGHEKCRYPVLASRYAVRSGEVLHANLDQHLDYIEP